MIQKIAGFIIGFGLALALVFAISMWAGVMPKGLGWLALLVGSGYAGSRWLSGLWPSMDQPELSRI